jgi:mannose-6-phosphate isomerase-like protein (cupin superfamily)
MSSLTKGTLNNPDETRSFNKGKLELVTLDGVTFSRLTLEPGWKWSEAVQPIVKTPSCQVHHVGFVVSGYMRVKMDNGEEQEFGPGDTYIVPPGHDAWIVGNDTYVAVDVSGEMMDYAKR